MKRLIIIISILFISVVVTAYFYFENLNKSSAKNEHALQTSLQSSVFSFSFNNDATFYHIVNDLSLFNTLLGEDKTQELIAVKNLLIHNDKINRLINNNEVFISLVPDNKNKFDLVYIAQLNETAALDKLLTTLNTGGTKASIIDKQFKIEGQLNTTFYAEIKNNMAVLSSNNELVRSIMESKDTSFSAEKSAFLELSRMNLKNSLAKLYVNFDLVNPLYKTLLVSNPSNNFKDIAATQALSVLNFNYSEQKLQFTGSTLLSSDQNYLHTFLNQKPQKITIPNILPKNTADYVIYTIDNFSTWQQSYEAYLKNFPKDFEKRSQVISSTNEQLQIDVVSFFKNNFSNEFGAVTLGNSEKLGILKIRDTANFKTQLSSLANIDQNGYIRFKKTQILPSLYGDVFGAYNNPTCIIYDSYLIIANSVNTLQQITNAAKNNGTLSQNINYQNYANQIASDANVSYFLNNIESKKILKKKIRWEFYQHYIPDKSKYNQIYALGTQLAAEHGKFQTVISIINRVDEKEKIIADSTQK